MERTVTVLRALDSVVRVYICCTYDTHDHHVLLRYHGRDHLDAMCTLTRGSSVRCAPMIGQDCSIHHAAHRSADVALEMASPCGTRRQLQWSMYLLLSSQAVSALGYRPYDTRHIFEQALYRFEWYLAGCPSSAPVVIYCPSNIRG